MNEKQLLSSLKLLESHLLTSIRIMAELQKQIKSTDKTNSEQERLSAQQAAKLIENRNKTRFRGKLNKK